MKSYTLISVYLVVMATSNLVNSNSEDKRNMAGRAFYTLRRAINAAWDIWNRNANKEITDGIEQWMASTICMPGIEERLAACFVDPLTIRSLSNFPGWYPSNATQLGKFCNDINGYAPCLLKWELLCKSESKLILGAVLDACKHGSAFHEGVKENIECMYRTFMNNSKWEAHCESSSLNLLAKFSLFQRRNMTQLYPELSSNQSSDIREILLVFNGLGCYLKHLECPTAENTVLEVYARLYSGLRPKLTDEIKAVTSEIMDHLRLGDEQKIQITGSMRKYEDKCENINCGEYENQLHALYSN